MYPSVILQISPNSYFVFLGFARLDVAEKNLQANIFWNGSKGFFLSDSSPALSRCPFNAFPISHERALAYKAPANLPSQHYQERAEEKMIVSDNCKYFRKTGKHVLH